MSETSVGGIGTHVHTGTWLTRAVFLQVPALPAASHALPPAHTAPPILVTQVPAAAANCSDKSSITTTVVKIRNLIVLVSFLILLF
jgi:hypothetical protein